MTDGWHEKLARASARGYAGVRVTGDTAWLEKKDWKHFCEYEESLNEAVANQRLAVLCTYPLAACGALEILDVVRTHQFALARRQGSWDVIETAGLKQAKAEIKRLNEELEQRVEERTSQLMQASEALREAQTALAHVNRVATMGQLAASIAHEVKQPHRREQSPTPRPRLRWLAREPPNLEEAGSARCDIVQDGNRAVEVVGRIRALITKAPPRKDRLEINEAILEVIALTRGEMVKNGVSVQPQLAARLAAYSRRSSSTATSDPELDHQRRRSDEQRQRGVARVANRHAEGCIERGARRRAGFRSGTEPREL